ncbi:PAS domain-containing protein, partial [Halochromatium sp.]
MNILGGLIHNASLLLALVLAHGLFMARLPRERLSTQALIGLMFGVTALLGMAYPVTFGPLIFDGRTVVIGMAGLFGGIPAAIISGLVAIGYRAWLGGPGVMMGIATIVTAAALGSLFYHLRRRGRAQVTFWTLLAFGFAVHLASLAWVVLLPATLRIQVLTDVALPFLFVLPLIGVLIGLLLRDQEQRVSDERALRRSEARLREAQSFLKTLIATIPDLVWLKDPDGVYLACNPRFERFVGATEAEVIGRRDADFVAAEQAAAFRQSDRDAIAAGAPTLNRETLIFADDGHQEQVETIKTPMFDAEGGLVGVLGIARDVSARLQMYEALTFERDRIQELHERIEKIAAHVPGMIYQFQRWPDGHSAFPFASEGVKAIYGIDPDTLMEDASPVLAVLHPDDLERIKVSIQRSAEALTTWQETYRVRFPDGRTQWVEGEASPQRQPDGSVLWHGYIHDVTRSLPNRRLLTDRLEHAIAQLRRKRNALAVCYLDLDGFKPVNDRYGHAVGDRFLVKVSEALRQVVRGE